MVKGRKAVGTASSAEITRIMRERVANQDLPPGSRIEEARLSEEFGISRTIVREVLSALEQRGLVEKIPNRGAIVKRMDPKEIYEVFDVREVLEGLCTRQATLNGTPEIWKPFHDDLGEDMRLTIERGDIHIYDAKLDELRDATLRVADNTHAAQLLAIVLDKARVIRRRVTLLPGRAELGRNLHRKMLEAMMRNDANEAELIKREIIASARAALQRYHQIIL